MVLTVLQKKYKLHKLENSVSNFIADLLISPCKSEVIFCSSNLRITTIKKNVIAQSKLVILKLLKLYKLT